ncbi:hypothetical protein Q0Z83_027390 [Actinoplanes sichuanensis]|uniref:Uncharacterized protein n=1 Tax=Actinoplanes sichuanensis TaxID=512349 RepID=A0ABW4AXR1_9ACTN|nr:hypothetical protein [Actinoplanes sichuanensis]BEL04548.1 hypothetical protein Q0Z83_027390 [Actinoplanes sichuanensis]
MIIIPDLLLSLLRQVDEDLAAVLALDYAEQSLRTVGHLLPAELLEASVAYLDAARGFVESAEVDSLKSAHERFFDVRSHAEGLPATASWIAAIAVSAACQRGMEESGMISRNRYQPTVLDVAAEAQKLAGLLAAGAEASRSLRWEAARRQLVLLIEAVRPPNRNPRSP